MALEKVLVVDDDPNICEVLRMYLENEGYSVILSYDGEEALVKFNALKPDVILLDVMLPSLDGWQVCREVRKKSSVPIIMITAKGDTFDKVLGLELGADDYVVKPFSPKELMLRVSAILKRVKKSPETTTNFFRLGGLSVDFTARIVKIDGKRIELSPKEYELLFYMIRNANIALTREKLICEVWGYDFYGDDRTLDTHIKLLRRSLGEYSRYIVTLRGVGYRFDTNQ